MRNREILGRQFKVVVELLKRSQGLSSEKLAERLGVSRATVDRDLKLLREKVGLRIVATRKSGEVWHKLDEAALVTMTATPLQVAALRLAREALAPLSGTALVRQIDGLIAMVPGAPAPLPRLAVIGKPQRSQTRIMEAIDVALSEKRQLSIVVRVAARDGEEGRYRLDPLMLRVVEDEPYLLGWAHERTAPRTFKVARIREAVVRTEQAGDHPEVDIEAVFAGAVKAWSGERTRVRVRLSPSRAWLVDEYPLLPGQEVLHEADGSCVVSAEVAGMVEAVRWVMSWGRNAVALDPPSFVEAVASELGAALGGYGERRVHSACLSGDDGGAGSISPRGGAPSASRSKEAT